MAKRKGNGGKKYTSKTGYTPSQQTVDKLRSSVRNYNQRIKAATKRFEGFEDLLPKQTSIESIIDTAVSVKDINTRIKELERFKGKGFNLTSLPSGEAITEAELQNIKDRIKFENKYRSEKAKLKQAVEEESGRFYTDKDKENLPVSITDRDTLERLRIKQDYYTMYNKHLQADRWKQTYITKLEQALGNAVLSGVGLDTIDALQWLIDMINGIDTLALTTLAAYTPALDITITSDENMLVSEVESLVSEWEEFTEEYLT